MCNSDTPDLDITTIYAITALCFSIDFIAQSIYSDVIQTIISSITLQAITPAEQALGKSIRGKLQNMDAWGTTGSPVNTSNSINFMTYKCSINLFLILLKTILS